MRERKKKLSLSRETVKHLDETKLIQANGGVSAFCYVIATYGCISAASCFVYRCTANTCAEYGCR